MTLGENSVLPVMDRLDSAHTETISWLERRLGEVARTGSSALQATPLQVFSGQVRRVAGAPFALAATGVNQVGALVGRLTRSAPAAASQVQDAATSAAETVADRAGDVAGQAADVASSAAGTVTDAVSSATDTVGSAADAAAGAVSSATDTAADAVSTATDTAADAVSTATDTVADAADSAADAAPDALPEPPADPAATAEQVTREVLEATGGDDVADAKAPFAGYERLPGDSVMRHIDDTEDVEELRTLLAFEQAHKARKGVLTSAQKRLSALAES